MFPAFLFGLVLCRGIEPDLLPIDYNNQVWTAFDLFTGIKKSGRRPVLSICRNA
ncbi:hypothetical protein HMPREF3213_03442 [Heyndrickxia coagulans]|uniref:Uncharacterized protein n=1 Tax=Heyndrickxia coagulans TaxID=1398 RepID=A0A133KCG1_HEYCO|nr:hypothetical protein HMPREF3213_03442 [Heyndrickxia coagulans]